MTGAGVGLVPRRLLMKMALVALFGWPKVRLAAGVDPVAPVPL